MKFQSILKYASTLAIATGLPVGFSAGHAADAPMQSAQITVQIPGINNSGHVEWGEDKRRQLRRAFWLLEHTNHEYNGYKTAALDQVRWAAEKLGMDLHGEGYGEEHERDGYHGEEHSDENLRRAKHILEDVAGETGGHEHEHLRDAIKDIDRALQVH
jgi:hypothetical protein